MFSLPLCFPKTSSLPPQNNTSNVFFVSPSINWALFVSGQHSVLLPSLRVNQVTWRKWIGFWTRNQIQLKPHQQHRHQQQHCPRQEQQHPHQQQHWPRYKIQLFRLVWTWQIILGFFKMVYIEARRSKTFSKTITDLPAPILRDRKMKGDRGEPKKVKAIVLSSLWLMMSHKKALSF